MILQTSVMGSPPHTWRILIFSKLVWYVIRITSTHVENTTLLMSVIKCNEDHLHTRGEYEDVAALDYRALGSPPHTWRIQDGFYEDDKLIGITSTHVENTKMLPPSMTGLWDHLHTRGEYTPAGIAKLMSRGSPPHTWRIQLAFIGQKLAFRITSTHVENTVNKSQYNNNHKTIDPKISSLCQLLLYLFLSH